MVVNINKGKKHKVSNWILIVGALALAAIMLEWLMPQTTPIIRIIAGLGLIASIGSDAYYLFKEFHNQVSARLDISITLIFITGVFASFTMI